MISLPLSPSSIKLFETCPRRYYRERIVRDVVSPDSEAAREGTRIHALFEAATKAQAPWPAEWPRVAGWFAQATEGRPQIRAEQRLMLGRGLERWRDWKTAWIRGVADLMVWDGRERSMLVVDYKTGGFRPETARLQILFYTLAAFQLGREVEAVTTDVFWIRSNRHQTVTWHRDEILALKGAMREHASRVENATEYPARPSGLCRGWCGVTDCEHWRPA